MKIDFSAMSGGSAYQPTTDLLSCRISGETDRLTDVLLCPPLHLSPVPCCAVTRAQIEKGFTSCTDEALRQHAALVRLLQTRGVRCHMLRPEAGLADMCFTRDVAVTTPWGLVALNPAMPHRRPEVDALIGACAGWNLPVTRTTGGTIEGGDVCVAREGLLIVGTSGERTSRAGLDAFARPFRSAGWDILVCPFHADHLHLDTIFCMVSETEAVACVELLDANFVEELKQRGIGLLPLPSDAAATLSANILALGDRRIIASSCRAEVVDALRAAGYDVDCIDISQFAACGGGIHCLTMPLRREAA